MGRAVGDLEDQQLVIDALTAALAGSGMSQASFAAALGTSQPRLSTYVTGRVMPSAALLVRAQRLSDALQRLGRLHLWSGVDTAGAVRNVLAAGSRPHAPRPEREALRTLLQGRDHLRLVLAEYPDLALAWHARPRPVGRPGWDAFLAAVTAHEFEQSDRSTPSWSQQPRLAEPWVYPSALLSPAEVLARTPAWLADRDVHVAERDLTTA